MNNNTGTGAAREGRRCNLLAGLSLTFFRSRRTLYRHYTHHNGPVHTFLASPRSSHCFWFHRRPALLKHARERRRRARRLTTPPDPAIACPPVSSTIHRLAHRPPQKQREAPTLAAFATYLACYCCPPALCLRQHPTGHRPPAYPSTCPLTFFVVGHPHCRAHHATHLSRQSIETPFCLHSISQHGISGRRPRRLWPLAARCLARRCMLTTACDAPD